MGGERRKPTQGSLTPNLGNGHFPLTVPRSLLLDPVGLTVRNTGLGQQGCAASVTVSVFVDEIFPGAYDGLQASAAPVGHRDDSRRLLTSEW